MGLAFGIGIFLGILPGTGAVAAAAVAALLRLNVPVAVAGALLTNPLTVPFIYIGSYLLGSWLLGRWLPAHKIARILVGTAVGNLLLAFGMAIVGYLCARLLGVAAHRARRRIKPSRSEPV